MVKVKGTVVINEQLCKGCGLCVVACPKQVLSQAKEVNSKGYHYSYMEKPDQCIGCANCGIICPDGVITVYKEKTSDKES
jgi:2-oxoglutarate ferredoxin oxidoreductase subunit delta